MASPGGRSRLCVPDTDHGRCAGSARVERWRQGPDFTLPGSDGKTYSLADLKGKTVVLAWFPKAFTGG